MKHKRASRKREGTVSMGRTLEHGIQLKDRRYFIGGSDARIIMGDDEAALIRLWKEKRGEVTFPSLTAAHLHAHNFHFVV